MSEMNGDTASIDFARIQDTSDGDKEFERELFEAYIEDCEDRIKQLREVGAASNTDLLRREAHTIKGASANVGTTQLQEIAHELERFAGELDDAAIVGIIDKMEAEFALVKKAILAYVDTL